MERTLCVWFPDWPLRRPDVPPAEPCQAVDDKNVVVAVNRLATESGIQVGMRRREAEAVCPTVTTIEHDPGAGASDETRYSGNVCCHTLTEVEDTAG